MAQRTFTGNAQRVQGVLTVTLSGAWAAGNSVTATVNGKSVTFFTTTTSAADAAAGLAAAVLASGEPEFGEFDSVTSAGAVVTILYPPDGTPVTVGFSHTGIGVVTPVESPAPTGPNWWNNPANWLEGVVPAAGDVVTYGELARGVPVKFGLPGAAVAYASLDLTGAYAGGWLGLPSVNENGYPEYRPQYLVTSCPSVSVGEGSGVGPALVKIDSAAAAATLNVYGTDAPADGDHAVYWKGSAAGSVLNRAGGTVRVAPRPGDAATVASLEVTKNDSGQGVALAGATAPVYLGAGATVASLAADGADVECWGLLGDAHVGSATLTLAGQAAATGTVTVHEGGVLKHNSSGHLGAVILDAGTADWSGDPRPHTVTSIDCYADAVVNDPDGTLVAAGFPTLTTNECGLGDVTLNVGQHLTVNVAAR